MKFISAAVLALVANVQAIKYDKSEGPTKVDLGEADETVLPRTLDEAGKWSNPLSWHDDGTDDDIVLTQMDSTRRHKHHKKHHKRHLDRDAYDGDYYDGSNFAQRRSRSNMRRVQVQDRFKARRDEYDADPTTVSPYDDMYQHKTFDWGVPEGEPGSKGPWGHYFGTWTSGVA